MTDVLLRRGKGNTERRVSYEDMEKPREKMIMRWQRQRWGRCSISQGLLGIFSNCQKWGEKHETDSQSSQKESILLTHWFWISSLQNFERMHFCGFQSSSLWSWLWNWATSRTSPRRAVWVMFSVFEALQNWNYHLFFLLYNQFSRYGKAFKKSQNSYLIQTILPGLLELLTMCPCF